MIEEENEEDVVSMFTNLIKRTIELSKNSRVNPARTWSDPLYNKMHDDIVARKYPKETLKCALLQAEEDFFGESLDEDDEEITRFVNMFSYNSIQLQEAAEQMQDSFF